MMNTPAQSHSATLIGAPPHRLGGHTHHHILRAWLAAATLIGACGVVLFGLPALIVIATCVGTSVLTDAGFAMLARRRWHERWKRAALTGMLLALTLPAVTPWPVALFAAVIAVVVGQGVFMGMLQPALVGRVVAQFVFSGHLSLAGTLMFSPILTPGHLLFGDLNDADRVVDYHGWLESQVTTPHHAYELRRPVQMLRQFAQDHVEPDNELIYTPLLRDHLPPWEDTIFGVVPGGIGETCTIGLIVAGLFLIHRGYLRWQLPLAVLLSAAIAVAILPIESRGDYRWFPVFEIEQGRAVGLAYVLYHLTAGQLMLTAFLLAGDVMSSPLRVHGQMIYAAGIGVIAMFMRLYGLLDGECYWAVLIMNVFVGTIDRNLRRPVFGLES